MGVFLYFLVLCLNKLNITFAAESINDVELPVCKSINEVEVNLYYEVHCPLSIYIYYRNFTNLVDMLGSSITINTYPFGNAKFLDAAKTKIKCQHGIDECYGNKLHACAIEQLKRVDKYLEYNSCVIANGSDDRAADNCGKALSIDSESIKNCAKSQEGQDLLIYHGKETLKVRPGQKYSPYILINGKEFDGVHGTLIEEVCTIFKNPPEACKTI